MSRCRFVNMYISIAQPMSLSSSYLSHSTQVSHIPLVNSVKQISNALSSDIYTTKLSCPVFRQSTADSSLHLFHVKQSSRTSPRFINGQSTCSEQTPFHLRPLVFSATMQSRGNVAGKDFKDEDRCYFGVSF